MKILLIGASGDVGQAAYNALSERHTVISVGRRSGDLQADITDRDSIANMYQATGKVDAVVCTAGNVHFAPLESFTESDFMLGLTDKVMGQINLVIEGIPWLNDHGSFTLTSGVLDRDPIHFGVGAATANGAIGGFVVGAAIQMPRNLRINTVSPGLLDTSVEAYGHLFPGHETVESSRVGRAYVKSVEGLCSGKVLVVD